MVIELKCFHSFDSSVDDHTVYIIFYTERRRSDISNKPYVFLSDLLAINIYIYFFICINTVFTCKTLFNGK